MTASAALVALLFAQTLPYNRTRTDDSVPRQKAHCLYWDLPEITYQQHTAPVANLGSRAFEAITASFNAWQAVADRCGNFRLVEGSWTTDKRVDYDPNTSNRNVILYRTRGCSGVAPPSDACWNEDDCNNVYDCWSGMPGTIALTTTFFDRNSGKLFDADMEFNAANWEFQIVDGANPCDGQSSCRISDLQNTAVHEIGHFLGLDHVAHAQSTMFASAQPGETNKRSLDTGSQQFVCDTYPKGRPSQNCIVALVGRPSGNAMVTTLGDEDTCSSAAGSPLLLLGAALLLRRRRGSPRPA